MRLYSEHWSDIHVQKHCVLTNFYNTNLKVSCDFPSAMYGNGYLNFPNSLRIEESVFQKLWERIVTSQNTCISLLLTASKAVMGWDLTKIILCNWGDWLCCNVLCFVVTNKVLNTVMSLAGCDILELCSKPSLGHVIPKSAHWLS